MDSAPESCSQDRLETQRESPESPPRSADLEEEEKVQQRRGALLGPSSAVSPVDQKPSAVEGHVGNPVTPGTLAKARIWWKRIERNPHPPRERQEDEVS